MKRQKLALAILLTGIAIPGLRAQTQDLAQGEKALLMIGKFANDICNKPDLTGKSTSVEVEGKAKAEVSKLVKQLTDLKVEGAVKFGRTDYEGLLQKDLLPALQDSTKCKEKIFNDLKDRFLPKPLLRNPLKDVPDFKKHSKSWPRLEAEIVRRLRTAKDKAAGDMLMHYSKVGFVNEIVLGPPATVEVMYEEFKQRPLRALFVELQPIAPLSHKASLSKSIKIIDRMIQRSQTEQNVDREFLDLLVSDINEVLQQKIWPK